MNFFDWFEKKIFTNEAIGWMTIIGISGTIGYTIFQLIRYYFFKN